MPNFKNKNQIRRLLFINSACEDAIYHGDITKPSSIKKLDEVIKEVLSIITKLQSEKIK